MPYSYLAIATVHSVYIMARTGQDRRNPSALAQELVDEIEGQIPPDDRIPYGTFLFNASYYKLTSSGPLQLRCMIASVRNRHIAIQFCGSPTSHSHAFTHNVPTRMLRRPGRHEDGGHLELY